MADTSDGVHRVANDEIQLLQANTIPSVPCWGLLNEPEKSSQAGVYIKQASNQDVASSGMDIELWGLHIHKVQADQKNCAHVSFNKVTSDLVKNVARTSSL